MSFGCSRKVRRHLKLSPGEGLKNWEIYSLKRRGQIFWQESHIITISSSPAYPSIFHLQPALFKTNKQNSTNKNRIVGSVQRSISISSTVRPLLKNKFCSGSLFISHKGVGLTNKTTTGLSGSGTRRALESGSRGMRNLPHPKILTELQQGFGV